MNLPISYRKDRHVVPPGFLPSKPLDKPLEQLSKRELNDRYLRNRDILNGPGPSTESHQRFLREQAAIENILGMEHLQNGLDRTHITEDDPMGEPAAVLSRTVDTKRRILGRYHNNLQQRGTTVALGLDEAIALEQKAHIVEMERKKQEEEKRQRGLPRPGEMLTYEERAAMIWSYMNAKPSESDEEDAHWNDSDEDEDENDPSTWFEEEDETQGQPLIDPDELIDIIRLDESHWHD
ncbi:hypothetical protein Clacol_001465 [Clathrus columnatus]|uniref:Uncharacterized protein n=1 Tax=Clathrus columnatus TaxID=1419009 RepID=A0AAV5A2P3_9AGAM|nr:hypothetical protein Clacol_001465 [Clathrus columnatus]